MHRVRTRLLTVGRHELFVGTRCQRSFIFTAGHSSP